MRRVGALQGPSIGVEHGDRHLAVIAVNEGDCARVVMRRIFRDTGS